MNASLAVVIPTIGRVTLLNVIRNIRIDCEKATIICVANSVNYEKTYSLLKSILSPDLILLKNPKTGIGSSLNLGLGAVETDYFALFSDDDEWICGRLEKQLETLRSNQDIDFVLGSVEYCRYGSRQVRRPQKLIEKSIIEAIDVSVWDSSYYTSLTTFLGKSHIKKITFRENLDFWEDISWLMDLEKSRYSFSQTTDLVARVYNEQARSNLRISKQQCETIIFEVLANEHKLLRPFLLNFVLRPILLNSRLYNLLPYFDLLKYLKTVDKLRIFLAVAALVIVKLPYKLSNHLRKASNWQQRV
jgi:hypothetical protein